MSKLLEQVLLANIYIQPVHFCVTITTNILNIRILCSRVLRSSPCTHYFLAYAVFSIIYTCIICPTEILRSFYIEWSNTRVTCKIQYYIVYLPPFLASVMLVLASFDRYCSSSQSRQLHSASTTRTAKFSIVIGTILFAIYLIPMLIIYNWDVTTNTCLQYSNPLISVYISSQIILFYIAEPILMAIFGLLTISNIRRHVTRIGLQPVLVHGRRTERQLARMLLLQISVHLILTVPFGVVYSMNAFAPSTRTPNILAVRYILVIWQQCDYFMSFFLYVLSGSAYREQLIRILKFIKCRNPTIHPLRNQQTGIRHEHPMVDASVPPIVENHHAQS
jgi:hypothetical protein